MIDTQHTVETPEGVELDLPAAGPVPRALAWLVDAVVQIALYLTLFQLIGMLPMAPAASWGLLMLGVFAIQWFYGVAFEVLNRGRSPGKMALDLQVVRDDGTPVTFGSSVVRNFLRVVDSMPYVFGSLPTYGLGLATALLDPSFRRLGDLAAGTLVVYRPRIAPPSPPAEAEPLAPAVPLDPEERQAVIAFAERAPLLSEARADELAAIPTPLLTDASADPRQQLLRIASWLLGARRGDWR